MKNEEKPLVNRVALSNLLTIDLAKYFPSAPIIELDIKHFLFQGLILKEKDFREQLKLLDWSEYEGKVLAVYCSVDAIVPVWGIYAYRVLCSTICPGCLFWGCRSLCSILLFENN